MKVEIILVKDKKERDKVLDRLEKEVMAGKPLTKTHIILTPELFAKIFSPQKIRLLKELSDTNCKSITELAKKLDRKFESVHRDLKLFEHYSIIKFVKNNNSVIPELIGHISIPTVV